MKRLAEILVRMKAIEVEVRTADAENLVKLEKELDGLLEEKRTLEEKEIELRNKFTEGNKIIVPEEGKNKTRKVSVYETMEYRQEFMDYVLGKNKDILKRADAETISSEIAAVIPTAVLNKIVEAMDDYGDIFPLITKTNYPGAVDIPTSSAKPTATWVAEGSVADTQEKTTGKISFSYYKLQIRVAVSLIASVVSLDVFEKTISLNIAEAMVAAIEIAVINGTGSGQPEGIAINSDVTEVAFQVADATYSGWLTKFIGSIPLAYRKAKKGRILMNPATFDAYVWGLVDTNGQPVARMTYGLDGKIVYRLFGYEVLLRNEITSLVGNPSDKCVALYVDLSDYMLNTNMQITTRRYFDEGTDQYIQKSTMICDGKLADTHGVVRLQTAV